MTFDANDPLMQPLKRKRSASNAQLRAARQKSRLYAFTKSHNSKWRFGREATADVKTAGYHVYGGYDGWRR